MSGLTTAGQIAALDEAGQCWVTQFRKALSSAATITNAWVDYSYAAGSPPANFYASSPLEAAELEASRGIYLPAVSPATQHIKSLTLMTATATAAGRQTVILADYLMYYPFIDTDAVGEEQILVNNITIPRYSGGKVIAVSQSASSAVGQFTFNYTRHDGTAGRASANNYTIAVAGGGQILSASGVGASYQPFCALESADHDVQSIESVTFTAAGGGLMALVIVKPLFVGYVTQECRTTSGVAFGSADEFLSLIHFAGAPQVKDGAVLNLLAAGNAASLSANTMTGIIETVWN